MRSLLAALEYSRRGWPVLMIANRTKRPFFYGPLCATTDEETIRSWYTAYPQAGVGVMIGRESGLMEVEEDGPGCVWPAGLDLNAPAFVSQRGVHRIYALPREATEAMRQRQWKIGDLDIRCGLVTAEYMILPPSIHGSGFQRRWISDSRDPPAFDPAASIEQGG